MTPATPRVVATIFDCDGTLADTEDAWTMAETVFCLAQGIERGSRPSTHGLSMADTVRLLMGPTSGRAVANAQREFVRIASDIVPARARMIPGAGEALEMAAHYSQLAVASNSPRVILEPVLDALGITPLLQVIVAGDDVRSPKPAPDVYVESLSRLGCDARAAVAFEDSRAGVLSAHRAGVRVIHVGPAHAAPIPEAAGWIPSLWLVARDPERFQMREP